MKNELSIIICTYNRAEKVSKLLQCFDNNVILPDNLELEILLVDNRSSDHTKDIVSETIGKKRRYILQYSLEEKSGLSNARNKGIREAKYKKLSFLDDDILPDKQFLVAISNALSTHPDTLCFAHKVINQHVHKPDWYRISGKHAMLDRGNYDLGNKTRFLLVKDPLPIGSGMIVDKEVFHTVGPFRTELGYDLKKSMLIPGEETDFFSKVRQKEMNILYVHDAIVYHYPEPDKYDLSILSRTYMGVGYWYGREDAKMVSEEYSNFIAGFPLAYYRRFLRLIFPYLLSRLMKKDTIKNFYLFEMKKTIGYFKGFRERHTKCRSTDMGIYI